MWNLHLIVEELLIYWTEVETHWEATAPRQDFQILIGRVDGIMFFLENMSLQFCDICVL